jgi:hypothetical protein
MSGEGNVKENPYMADLLCQDSCSLDGRWGEHTTLTNYYAVIGPEFS